MPILSFLTEASMMAVKLLLSNTPTMTTTSDVDSSSLQRVILARRGGGQSSSSSADDYILEQISALKRRPAKTHASITVCCAKRRWFEYYIQLMVPCFFIQSIVGWKQPRAPVEEVATQEAARLHWRGNKEAGLFMSRPGVRLVIICEMIKV